MFLDRHDAGAKLAESLLIFRTKKPIVVALPRGGVPVGYEVAWRLKAPLDLLIVRKIGAPENPEFGIGALAENSAASINYETAAALGISPPEIEEAIVHASQSVKNQIQKFRGGKPMRPLLGRSVILVDDGLATGVTAKAAIHWLQKQKTKEIIFAVPVASPGTLEILKTQVSQLIYLLAPTSFSAVGLWYEDFSQVTDQEVLELLDAANQRVNLAA